MVNKAHLHTLKSGLVLDRSVFRDLTSNQMAEVITNLPANIGGLMVVDDADMFFTPDTLIRLFSQKDGRFILVNEKINFFTEEVANQLMDSFQPANGLKAEVIKPIIKQEALVDEYAGGVVVKAKAPEVGAGYQFAVVPPNWNVAAHMSLGPNKMKRRGSNFYLSPMDLEGLWLAASRYWAKVPGSNNKMAINTPNGLRTATFSMTNVVIGHDSFLRHEIEQVAKHRGWAFPQVAAIAA